jgi:ribose/xylose/arabinose/galactoside ABC-type transport system permease subunit
MTRRTLFRKREFTVFGLIVVLAVVFSLTTERFLSMSNLTNLLLQLAGTAICAIGMTMIIITGGIDVSVGSMLGMSSVVAGKLLMGNAPVLLVVLAAMGVGLLMGLTNGSLIAYGKVPPIIVTLGMLNIIRSLLFQLLGGAVDFRCTPRHPGDRSGEVAGDTHLHVDCGAPHPLF